MTSNLCYPFKTETTQTGGFLFWTEKELVVCRAWRPRHAVTNFFGNTRSVRKNSDAEYPVKPGKS